jgi:glutamate/aspartate transport system permease protein
LDWGVIWEARRFLAEGLAMSGLLVLVGAMGGLILGAGLALLRLSHFRVVAMVAAAYVTIMRSVPLILVLFWFYFMLPLAVGRPIGALFSALTAFVLFEAAFYCEIIRAGISSVSNGQSSAAAATGLRRWQVLRLVILPQAMAAMVPLLLNQIIILFQDTSLVYVVGLHDFLTAANVIAGREERPIEMYTFVAVVYFAICFSVSLFVGRSKGPIFR